MSDAQSDAYDMLAVFRARLAYAEKIQAQYDSLMAEFDAEVAHIESKRAIIVKEFEQGPEVIATYKEKVANQFRIIRHIAKRTKVIGQRATGKPIRTQAPIEKLRNLRRQMAKLEQEIDTDQRDPEGVAKREAAKLSRWSHIRTVEGVTFRRDRTSRDWFYSDAGGGTVYGPFKTFTEAKKNASV